MWDQHMHCMFSGDSDADPVLMIKSAINKGLDGICFTDHLDYDYKEEPGLFDLDIAAYEKRIKRLAIVLKEKGCPVNIHWGIEIGLQPHITDKNNGVTKKYPFDLVIGSSHVVNGIDPYYPAFYKGKTEHEAYTEYFESILDNLHSGADFDVYGHIDYVVRYGPDKNKYYSYEKYADIIDAILKEIISQGKGIELNTAGFKYGLGHPNPTEAVLKRYQSEQMPTSRSMSRTILTRFQISSRMPGLCTIQYLKTAFLLSSNYSPALKAYVVILSNY